MSAIIFWKDWHAWLEIFLLFGLLIALAIPLGGYMAQVYQGKPLWVDKIINPIEKVIYRISWINSTEEMSWQDYAKAVILLGLMSFLLLYTLLRLQYFLPLNPQNYIGVQPDLAFNIAISFLTNTDWQSYQGEKVLSYFSQMVGLTVQNFVSAATGMAVAVALVRALVKSNSKTLGNFWVDVTRGILYILLPLAIIMAILLGSQGVIQNFNEYLNITPIDLSSIVQQIPGGPVASQVAIKQLGSNGGGFFGANAAHPFENPTPFSNFLELLAILLIPVSFIIFYGKMIKQPKQSRALLWLLFTVFIVSFLCCAYQELNNNLINYEGKEYRHGILNSALWSVATTATSNGSTNSLLGSYSPLGGMVPLLLILTGELIFGGVGQGLYSLLLYIFITVFIAGLMAGRMPEYLGKKIESFEIKMTVLAIWTPVLSLLVLMSMTLQLPIVGQMVSALGSKGFSEILYAFASTVANNGSAFSGLDSNNLCLNTIFGFAMMLGRYGVILPVLAIAGSLIQKNTVIGENKNSLRPSVIATDSMVFIILLLGIVLFMTLLSFMPVILMGPIAAHFSGLSP